MLIFMGSSKPTEETPTTKACEFLGRLLFRDFSDRGLQAVSMAESMYGEEAVRTALHALQDEVPEPLDLHVALQKASP
jgi:hypothetical protein